MDKNAKKNTSVKINETTVALPKASMTEDNLKKIEARIDTVFSTARRSTVDICECVGTIAKYNGFALLGYATIKEYCLDKYGIKDTQSKQMVRIFDRYAEPNGDGSGYSVPKDLKEFGAEKLDIIQRFPQFPKQGNVTDLARETIKALGLTPNDNVQSFKSALKIAQGKDVEKLEDKADGQPTDKDNVTTTLKAENDNLKVKVDDVKTIVADLVKLANDEYLEVNEYRSKTRALIHELHKKVQ